MKKKKNKINSPISIIKNLSKKKRDELKQKLEETDDSPNNLDVMPM